MFHLRGLATAHYDIKTTCNFAYTNTDIKHALQQRLACTSKKVRNLSANRMLLGAIGVAGCYVALEYVGNWWRCSVHNFRWLL